MHQLSQSCYKKTAQGCNNIAYGTLACTHGKYLSGRRPRAQELSVIDLFKPEILSRIEGMDCRKMENRVFISPVALEREGKMGGQLQRSR